MTRVRLLKAGGKGRSIPFLDMMSGQSVIWLKKGKGEEEKPTGQVAAGPVWVNVVPMREAKEQRARELILGLSFACPFYGQGLPECPLNEVRKMSLSERYEWSKTINEEEVQKLIECHKRCVENNIGALPSFCEGESE